MPRKAKAESPPDEELPFEVILERLEGVVEALEQGDAPLEDALSTFERGVALARLGAARLDEAERRIEVLLSDEPGAETRPLDGEPSDDE
jgi:exodeoxyribonuclease VII small subunit